jgi:hypothetical protein
VHIGEESGRLRLSVVLASRCCRRATLARLFCRMPAGFVQNIPNGVKKVLAVVR